LHTLLVKGCNKDAGEALEVFWLEELAEWRVDRRVIAEPAIMDLLSSAILRSLLAPDSQKLIRGLLAWEVALRCAPEAAGVTLGMGVMETVLTRLTEEFVWAGGALPAFFRAAFCASGFQPWVDGTVVAVRSRMKCAPPWLMAKLMLLLPADDQMDLWESMAGPLVSVATDEEGDLAAQESALKALCVMAGRDVGRLAILAAGFFDGECSRCVEAIAKVLVRMLSTCISDVLVLAADSALLGGVVCRLHDLSWCEREAIAEVIHTLCDAAEYLVPASLGPILMSKVVTAFMDVCDHMLADAEEGPGEGMSQLRMAWQASTAGSQWRTGDVLEDVARVNATVAFFWRPVPDAEAWQDEWDADSMGAEAW
jgi:hypothetical protein